MREGIIDQEKGTYFNPVTGQTMSIDDALDKNLLVVEAGRPGDQSDDEERVPSVHIDDELDALEDMGMEEVTEETKTFQITGVTDGTTGEMIPYDKALERVCVSSLLSQSVFTAMVRITLGETLEKIDFLSVEYLPKSLDSY